METSGNFVCLSQNGLELRMFKQFDLVEDEGLGLGWILEKDINFYLVEFLERFPDKLIRYHDGRGTVFSDDGCYCWWVSEPGLKLVRAADHEEEKTEEEKEETGAKLFIVMKSEGDEPRQKVGGNHLSLLSAVQAAERYAKNNLNNQYSVWKCEGTLKATIKMEWH